MPGMVTEASNPDEHLLPARHTKGDLFICDVADAVLKDIMPQMEHPFYSLSKKPETKIRRYEHNGNWLEIIPSVKGLATIYDKDILIYCISQNGLTDGALREYALAEIERAKWRFWNGYVEPGIIGLVHLAHWAAAQCFDHLPSLKKLSKSLLDVIRYLESNSDSMPNYGERFRAGTRISTEFAESAGRKLPLPVEIFLYS
jgi:hypothetical protein